jgi:ApaG protein
MSKPQFTCEVKVQYLPEQSQAPEGPFAFSYTVNIRNSGNVAAQLVARHWIITNADGRSGGGPSAAAQTRRAV